MKKFSVNTKSVSADDLLGVARKYGFFIKKGNKHYKVVSADGRFITTIPRHNVVKRETAKGIIETLNGAGAKIDFM